MSVFSEFDRRPGMDPSKSRGRRARASLLIEALEGRQLLSTGRYVYDFGPAGSPVLEGTVGVSFEGYSPGRGYGWENPRVLDARDRQEPDDLRRDFVFASYSGATFLVDIPNGTYNVVATLGDALSGHDLMAIFAEGQRVASGLTTTGANLWLQSSFRVVVTDGQLSVRFADEGGSNEHVTINALEIVAEAQAGSPLGVSAGGPYQGAEGSPVALTATASGGFVTAVYSYDWDLDNNGSYETAGKTVTKSFPDNGIYNVGVRVTSATGATATATARVTVVNVAPTANPGGPYTSRVGSSLNFQGSGTDPGASDVAAGFTYAWAFGDGSTGTGATPSHVYATTGSFEATLRVTDKDGAESPPVTTNVTVGSTPVDVVVPSPPVHMDTLPDFDATPSVVSVASGNWSDPTIWSTGRVPGNNDVVIVSEGTSIVYDVVSEARIKTIVIGNDDPGHGDHPGPMAPTSLLRFRTDINTRLIVGTVVVGNAGSLEVGTPQNPVSPNVRAEVMFADQAIDTQFDPFQFGNGLIGLGKVRVSGAPLNETFFRLASEPRAGQTTLNLSAPAIGWRVGDKLYLPDTRQDWNNYWGDHNPHWEEISLAGISADGRTLTLSVPLRFDHLGARDGNGSLDFLPHVANLSRNVVFASENPNGTRGHVIFMGRADTDVRYAAFKDLGRTLNTPLIDSTMVDVNGQVQHVGTNQIGRYPIHIHMLDGPMAPQANGRQFTLIGNAVDGSGGSGTTLVGNDVSNDGRWGITIHSSHYGLVQNNVVYDVGGGGIVTEDGSESFNRIENNFVSRVSGTGGRVDARGPNIAHEGSGIWLGGPNNVVKGNVVSNIVHAGYTPMGMTLAPVMIPPSQGAERSTFVATDLRTLPFLDFSNNESYAILQGIDAWYLGAANGGDKAFDGRQPNVIKDFTAWHIGQYGIRFYPANRVIVDGLVIRGDLSKLVPWGATGIYSGDYMVRGLIIRNADIQNVGTGMNFPTPSNGGVPLTVENTYLRNYTNIRLDTMWGDHVFLEPRKVLIKDTMFVSPNAPIVDGVPMLDFSMDYNLGEWPPRNVIVSDELYVENFNRVAGQNFRVYYEQQAANFIVPKTDSVLIGSPEAGLTNQQNWDKYGIAIAGSVAPANATPRARVKGLVAPY